MSTKATVANLPTIPTTTCSDSNEVVGGGGVVKIKKELPNDEIKEFAENTMNELLGWYGFDGVDRLDLTTKTSRLLTSAATAATNNKNCQTNRETCITSHAMEKRRRSRSRTTDSLHQEQIFRNNNNNNSVKNNYGKNATNCQKSTTKGGNESTTSDHDTRSSRGSHEDDSKSPSSTGKNRMEEKIDLNNCCWCRRLVPENAPEYLTTTDGPRYCSESCFTQSRRASFKKAKTCDWCKHVRHAVSYVDFQDGASQLQFCSDKCLNQYKMQIFCKETQAHLDMNPHLREQGLEAASNGANLITPDLWLRNCRSRSLSPSSTISVSPGPSELSIMAPVLAPLSPSACPTSSHLVKNSMSLKPTHKPIISVAPASKLMSKSTNLSNSRPVIKTYRRKRPIRACAMVNHNTSQPAPNHKPTSMGRDLIMSGKSNHNPHGINNMKSLNYNHNNVKTTTAVGLNQFAGSSVHDLHMSMSPISPILDQQSNSQGHAVNHKHGHTTSIPPAYFATPTHHSAQPSPNSNHQVGYAAAGPSRPPYAPIPTAPGMPGYPRFFNFPTGFQGQSPLQNPMANMPNQFPQADVSGIHALIGAPPPVTVMVPYPIIIPLPIPIPVPLPITDFYKAYRLQEPSERPVINSVKREAAPTPNNIDISQTHSINTPDEGPLDYTTAKDSLNEHNNTLIEASGANDVESQVQNSPTREYTNEKVMHCIGEAHEEDLEANELTNVNIENDCQQKLPKFKITRLQNKRSLVQARETLENSRPLRKRKRIIDCDFQKVALKDVELEELQETNNNNNNNNNEGHLSADVPAAKTPDPIVAADETNNLSETAEA